MDSLHFAIQYLSTYLKLKNNPPKIINGVTKQVTIEGANSKDGDMVVTIKPVKNYKQ